MPKTKLFKIKMKHKNYWIYFLLSIFFITCKNLKQFNYYFLGITKNIFYLHTQTPTFQSMPFMPRGEKQCQTVGIGFLREFSILFKRTSVSIIRDPVSYI